MITGVKIAKGLTIHTEAGREKGVEGTIDADTTAISGGTVPAGGGIKGGRNVGTQQTSTATAVGDRVFAYQLCRLRYTGGGSSKTQRSDPVRKGAFYSMEDEEAFKDNEIGALEVNHDLGGLELSELEDEIDDELDLSAIDGVERDEEHRWITVKKRSD